MYRGQQVSTATRLRWIEQIFTSFLVTTIVYLAQNNSLPYVIEDNTGRSKFRKELGYTGASIEQLAGLADSSKECSQSIKVIGQEIDNSTFNYVIT